MIAKRISVLILLICGFTFMAFIKVLYANPIINNAPQTIGHGSTITISGSGFGAKSNPGPQRWETWENGNAGQTPSQVSSYWTNGDNAKVSTSYNRNGYSQKNMKLSFPSSGGAWFYRGNSEFDKYYINFWIRWKWVDNSADVPSGSIQYQIKFFRLDNSHVINWAMAPTLPGFAVYYPKDGKSYVFWQPKVENAAGNDQVAISDGKLWSDNLPSFNDTTLPVWMNFVMLVDQTNITSTNYKIYLSNKTFSSPYERDTKNGINFNNLYISHRNERLKDIKFGGSVESGGPEYPVTLFVDDIYIDNTWARIEIGDKPQYDSCTHREVQIPSDWSSTKIQFTANKGSFNNDTTLYVYVSDANGTMNSQGFPVKFDSTVTSSSASSSTINAPPPPPGKPYVVN